MHRIYLNNLRSAEDILLINTNAGELSNMLHDLREASQMVYDVCVLSVMLYGLTVTQAKKSGQRLRICQPAMEQAMLGISLRDGQTNENIRAKTKVNDSVEQTASVGRPLLRRRDEIQRPAGKKWILTAQCRWTWEQMKEAYVQEWTETS
ncbi:hypothetical protein HUJ05_009605 [Dendroctonus ponderosae]|nr:hypothetical protein HUJ05_009605 [Dendroctonus ponderosae]